MRLSLAATWEFEHVFSELYSTLPTAFDSEHIDEDTKTLSRYVQANPQISAYIACEFNLALLLRRALTSLDLQNEVVCFDSPDSPV